MRYVNVFAAARGGKWCAAAQWFIIASACSLTGGLGPALTVAAEQEIAADIADVPVQDLRAGGDANKHYFLIGAAPGAAAPTAGYKLLVVLPGGDGSADFQPFVRRIYKNALGPDWLIAQLVAPRWDAKEFENLVWPTAKSRYPAVKFTTEQFVQAVVADVSGKVKVDPQRVFMLGWSSGGPPCYATALATGSPVKGVIVAMSVFKPEQLPPLAASKGKPFYLLQSPDDRVTPLRFATAAEQSLREAGAKVELQQYPGGHGWRGNVFQILSDGCQFLDRQAAP